LLFTACKKGAACNKQDKDTGKYFSHKNSPSLEFSGKPDLTGFPGTRSETGVVLEQAHMIYFILNLAIVKKNKGNAYERQWNSTVFCNTVTIGAVPKSNFGRPSSKNAVL
jgi:hypothetical protein